MRIMVAVAAAAAVVAPAPASAHVCVTPVEVPVGKPTAITVGVPAEVIAIGTVEIDVPAGFDLDEARRANGWTVAVNGSTVTYSGGSIPPLQCGYFTITGTATRKAQLTFPVSATDANGDTTEYGRGQLGAQVVYAGLKASPDEAGDGGIDTTTIAGIVLVAGGLLAAIALAIRRRAGRPAPRPSR